MFLLNFCCNMTPCIGVIAPNTAHPAVDVVKTLFFLLHSRRRLPFKVRLRQQRPRLLHEGVGRAPEPVGRGRGGEVPSVQGALQLSQVTPRAGEERGEALHRLREGEARPAPGSSVPRLPARPGHRQMFQVSERIV